MPRKLYRLSPSQKNALFSKIAIEGGISSLEEVQKIYYGMVRVIGRELKKHGIVVLPDWGRFKILEQKERRYGHIVTKEVKTAPAFKIVKYVPDQKLKEFVKNL